MARAIGGILRVNGFRDFLRNYGQRKTADDPVRRGLGLLGSWCHVTPAEHEHGSDKWHRAAEWVKVGCSVKWVGDLVRTGQIPKSCIVPGAGNGKQWRFYRSKIDRWIEGKN